MNGYLREQSQCIPCRSLTPVDKIVPLPKSRIKKGVKKVLTRETKVPKPKVVDPERKAVTDLYKQYYRKDKAKRSINFMKGRLRKKYETMPLVRLPSFLRELKEDWI